MQVRRWLAGAVCSGLSELLKEMMQNNHVQHSEMWQNMFQATSGLGWSRGGLGFAWKPICRDSTFREYIFLPERMKLEYINPSERMEH